MFTVFIAVVAAFKDMVYILCNGIHLKTAKTGMYIDISTIHSATENNFARKRSCSLSYPGACVR